MDIAANLEKLIVNVSHSLKEKGVPFCVTGGWAVGIWSTPRATEDLDLLVLIKPGEEETIVDYLMESVRIVQSHQEPMKFNEISIWRQVVSLPGSDDIFILDMVIADNPFLKQAVNRRIWVEFRGEELPIISIEDLILMKKISNRKQDQVDVENLIHSGQKIDWKYLNENGEKLGIKFEKE